MHQLRPYQRDALKASKQFYDSGVYRQLLVLPTGMGKTVCFAGLPEHHQIEQRMVVLVHRDELAEQAAQSIAFWNPKRRVGVEMGDSVCRPSDDIVVASVQTLAWGDYRRMGKFDPSEIGAVVPDEAHHSTAPSWKGVLERFGVLGNERRLLLGVTATPKRGDGEGLGAIYDEIIFNYPMLKAIEEGWLVLPRGYVVKTGVNLDEVHTSYGDFADRELSHAVNTPSRNRLVVAEWFERARERQTVAFTVDIAHAQALAKAYRDAGIKAEAIWGTDPKRSSKIDAHKAGDLQVLTNCGVLTEGYDDWQIGCIVMAKPTKSQLSYIQMVGRGTRIQKFPGGISLLEAREQGLEILKDDCIVLDVTDNSSRHSLVNLCSLFGLPPKLNLKGKGVIEAAEQFEQLTAKHPTLDLSVLEELDDLEHKVEEIDLFTVKYPEEVTNNSELQWHPTPAGNYVLLLPNKEKVTITRDLLDKWHVIGEINGNTFREAHKSVEHAMIWADKMVKFFGRSLMNLLRRGEHSTAKWKNEPISAEQTRMLAWQCQKRGKPMPNVVGMTKAEASEVINKLVAR
jgi:superfamily II DNA or RNA helicase